ncbi:MAG: hypothetical protein QM759_10895 [Terricaulis sp.]
MRNLLAIFFTLAALAACSKPPAPQAPAAPPSLYPSLADVTSNLGAIVAVGDHWRVDADPFYGLSVHENGRAAFSTSDRLLTGGTGMAFRYLVSDVSVGVTRVDCEAGGVHYPLTTTLDRVGKPQLKGCGFEPWATRVRAAVKIADACAPAGANAQRVTLFQVNGDGSMLVRLRGDAGGVDCHVVNSQLRAAPRDSALKFGGEGELDMIRGSRTAPDDACVASNIAMGEDGNLIGWFVPNDGKCRTKPLAP